MSESIRQSNLFAAEDYKKVFKAYSFIDYKAYDFYSLKDALIAYIRAYYPEDFNDYIESSEFIAIIELIAYLGTSLAFRTDLNSRENFIDTAERRDSVIRLAQMVNYVPKRNIPASGLFKIAAVQTNEPLVDANGININDVTIFWNDPNNPNWFDQFVQICNAAFSSVNPFGRPTKSGMIGSIPTDLYKLNNVLKQAVVYPVTLTINGIQYPVDICNPDFVTNNIIFERDPDPNNAFNFIYRNDSLGVSSSNTGFFLLFKQGQLQPVDSNFEFPVPNRVFPIGIENINQNDVYVQSTDQDGNVISKWKKVPALAGENIIYNSIQHAERNIFDVVSGANDTISIRFSDGNFGNVPTGLFRTWVRTSANQNLVIRPDSATGLQISIPYIGADQQQYVLGIVFNLEQTIANAAPSETNEQIKLRAPEVFSTQSRMVNGSDYNVLPLVYGNQIAKVQALDRTYSGQSRYIDLNDPTGFHKDLIIFGEDGALYRDNQNILTEVIRDSSNDGNIGTILLNSIKETLRDKSVANFFYDEYLSQFESTIRVNASQDVPNGYSLLDLGNPTQAQLYWKTSPAKFKNDTGYFANTIASDASAVLLTNEFDTDNVPNGIYQPWGFITNGAVLEFDTTGETRSIPVNTVIQDGQPLIVNTTNPYANIGPVELGLEIKNNTRATKVYPVFRSELTTNELTEILQRITDGISFWLYYDLLQDEWHTSTTSMMGISDQSTQPFRYAPVNINGNVSEIYSDWAKYPDSGLLYVNIANNNQITTTTYNITARGRVFVFDSYRDVRFYWEPGQIVVDNVTGLAKQDTIEIMPFVNTNNMVDNNLPNIPLPPENPYIDTPINFNITGVFVQDDGYQDPSKVKVSLVDFNKDGIPDIPGGFDRIVSPNDRVVFEYYNNEVSGYQSTRPWIAKWGTALENYTGPLYVYFPVSTSNTEILYGAPYIANKNLWNIYTTQTMPPHTTSGYMEFILTPEMIMENYDSELIVVYMDETDLVFITKPTQLAFDSTNTAPITLANQLTSFFNYDVTTYPWLAGTEHILDRAVILNAYFMSKSFLLSKTQPGFGKYFSLTYQETADVTPVTGYPTGKIVISDVDGYHYDKNGKTFTQNLSVPEMDRIPFYFKWSHYCSIDQRIDPSASNIIDMVVITNNYYTDMMNWKNNNGTRSTIPIKPSTEDLRLQFQDLNQYKMVSDSMVWNSGEFKILFGTQADLELQATFKVVKAPTTSISDNEIKTRVVQAIDAYFNIRNWDFGEKFFYTELAAFIHQQLSTLISSVVIVPNNSSSQFGNLFEIVAGPSQIFMSTATVNNVMIVSNLTDQNMRV